MRTIGKWIAFGLVGALIGSACGGGKALTKSEFIAAWDAICKDYDSRINALESEAPSEDPSEENLPQYAAAFQKAVPIFDEEISKLKEVTPPEPDQDTIDGILAELEQALDQIRKVQEDAASGDLEGVLAAGREGGTHIDAANQAAQSYGFKECGSE